MKIVIIGNGVAGVTVAETIRAVDKTSQITIISREPYPFYSRPRLIEYLAGTVSLGQITIRDHAWYDTNTIDLRLSAVITMVDTNAHSLEDAGANRYDYDKLVIASGATSFVPLVPGAGGPHVHTLRTFDDADKIKSAMDGKRNCVVVGGGLLGIEIANSLVTLGAQVRVVEIFDRLLPLQLDAEGSALMGRLLEQKGIKFTTGTQAQSIDENEGCLAVRLDNGESICSDFVVFSTGIRPDFQCIAHTAAAKNKGIIVDENMQTTVQDVYACGDVAEFNGQLWGLWLPAREQALACANHILGKPAPYKPGVPATRLKVAGIELASIGEIEIRDDMTSTVEKNEELGLYKKLLLRDNKLVGAILIGNTKEAVALQKTIKSGG